MSRLLITYYSIIHIHCQRSWTINWDPFHRKERHGRKWSVAVQPHCSWKGPAALLFRTAIVLSFPLTSEADLTRNTWFLFILNHDGKQNVTGPERHSRDRRLQEDDEGCEWLGCYAYKPMPQSPRKFLLEFGNFAEVVQPWGAHLAAQKFARCNMVCRFLDFCISKTDFRNLKECSNVRH